MKENQDNINLMLVIKGSVTQLTHRNSLHLLETLWFISSLLRSSVLTGHNVLFLQQPSFLQHSWKNTPRKILACGRPAEPPKSIRGGESTEGYSLWYCKGGLKSCFSSGNRMTAARTEKIKCYWVGLVCKMSNHLIWIVVNENTEYQPEVEVHFTHRCVQQLALILI